MDGWKFHTFRGARIAEQMHHHAPVGTAELLKASEGQFNATPFGEPPRVDRKMKYMVIALLVLAAPLHLFGCAVVDAMVERQPERA